MPDVKIKYIKGYPTAKSMRELADAWNKDKAYYFYPSKDSYSFTHRLNWGGREQPYVENYIDFAAEHGIQFGEYREWTNLDAVTGQLTILPKKD